MNNKDLLDGLNILNDVVCGLIKNNKEEFNLVTFAHGLNTKVIVHTPVPHVIVPANPTEVIVKCRPTGILLNRSLVYEAFSKNGDNLLFIYRRDRNDDSAMALYPPDMSFPLSIELTNKK